MMSQSIRLRRPISETLKGKIEAHAFTVGVLQDKKRRAPLPPARGVKSVAGGPARKLGGPSPVTNREVSKKLREGMRLNYLVRPFQKKNDDAVRMLKVFFDICFSESKSSKYRRLENLIQAIVRNPFLRGDYGSNSAETTREKGFNRKGIDTAQLFNVIKAKVFRQ